MRTLSSPSRPRSRRRFLFGAGAAVGLPLLGSLAPRGARAAEAPLRWVFYTTPNGFYPSKWFPTTTGTAFTLPDTLAPLAKHRSEIMILAGLDMAPATVFGDGTGDHARGTASLLTCMPPQKGSALKLDVSIDQLIAARAGVDTRFPSLQLGAEKEASAGLCDPGWSCAYVNAVSWSGPGKPLTKIVHPQTVFDRLVAGADGASSARERQRRQAYETSVLDAVLADVQSLRPALGRSDGAKLDEYLTGLRELEKRLRDGARAGAAACAAPPPRPADVLPPLDEHVRLMTDLTVLALRCDLTRVISFMLGNGLSVRVYPRLNATMGHHAHSHHGGRAEALRGLLAIELWEMTNFAYLLEGLRAVDDGAGRTLLDNTIVYFASDMEHGDPHVHRNIPTILAGRGNGALAPGGRFVRHPARTPMANLFVSLAGIAGVQVNRFGDSNGRIDGLG